MEQDFGFSAIESAVREAGYDGPIEIVRNDSIRIHAGPEFERFRFLHARPGGWVRTSAGKDVPHITTSSREWRVLVDYAARRLYRLYGFDRSEFSEVIRDSEYELDADGFGALLLARFYAEQVYPYARKATVPEDIFQIRRFAEDVLYEATVPPEQAKREVEHWIRKAQDGIDSALKETSAFPDGDGWLVRLAVVVRARAPRLRQTEPRVELRRLWCRVNGMGDFTLVSDELIAEFEARHE